MAHRQLRSLEEMQSSLCKDLLNEEGGGDSTAKESSSETKVSSNKKGTKPQKKRTDNSAATSKSASPKKMKKRESGGLETSKQMIKAKAEAAKIICGEILGSQNSKKVEPLPKAIDISKAVDISITQDYRTDESGKKALDAILTGNEFKELVKDWQASVVQTGQGQDEKVDELVIQEMTENGWRRRESKARMRSHYTRSQPGQHLHLPPPPRPPAIPSLRLSKRSKIEDLLMNFLDRPRPKEVLSKQLETIVAAPAPAPPQPDERTAFSQWIAARMSGIPHDRWDDFQLAAMRLMQDYSSPRPNPDTSPSPTAQPWPMPPVQQHWPHFPQQQQQWGQLSQQVLQQPSSGLTDLFMNQLTQCIPLGNTSQVAASQAASPSGTQEDSGDN